MARRIIQPITDHNDGTTCTLYYGVRFKLSSDSAWTDLGNVYAEETGSPPYWAIIIDNLEDDVNYDIEITRYCCEGTVSAVATDTILTTP
jgi:hypothetical protein